MTQQQFVAHLASSKMAIDIRVLSSETEGDYQKLLMDSPAAMFNHSLRYREFLRKTLSDAQDHYLLAYEADELLGAIPLFYKDGPFGVVVNSLPFYGSHGGVVTKLIADKDVTRELLRSFTEFCEGKKSICSTLIESPLAPNEYQYGNYVSDYYDERIGQITILPESADPATVEDRLLSLYHQKTRNMVRKGLKEGFHVTHSNSQETFLALHELHNENLTNIGGIAKPWSVFLAISEVFEYDTDYRIYTAFCNGSIVCALLVFYFKDMVEYFTPATLEAYRNHQPLSLLIFSAMRDAVVERNSKFWNWGGTWLSQDGVYKFKSRWGTIDYPYRYHVKDYRGSGFFEELTPNILLNEYPYFYTVPFSAIRKA